MSETQLIVNTVIITCGVIAMFWGIYLIIYSNGYSDGYSDGCEDTRKIFKQGGSNGM